MRFVFVLIRVLLCATTAEAQQALPANPPNLPHYVAGPSWFPSVLRPYQQELIRPPVMENGAQAGRIRA